MKTIKGRVVWIGSYIAGKFIIRADDGNEYDLHPDSIIERREECYVKNKERYQKFGDPVATPNHDFAYGEEVEFILSNGLAKVKISNENNDSSATIKSV